MVGRCASRYIRQLFPAATLHSLHRDDFTSQALPRLWAALSAFHSKDGQSNSLRSVSWHKLPSGDSPYVVQLFAWISSIYFPSKRLGNREQRHDNGVQVT